MKHFLLILTVFAAARVLAEVQTMDGYAAIVNDRVITVSDVVDFIGPNGAKAGPGATDAEIREKRIAAFSNGVQRLVEQALVVEEFKKNGGNLPERVVNDRVNEVIADRFHNDRAAFLKALADEKTTLDEWREGIRDRLVASMLRRQEVNDKVRVTPGQVRAAYEQRKTNFTHKASAKLRMIVLHKGKSDAETEAKRKEAELLREKITSAATFAEIAKTHSEDSKALNGGDWGWMDPDDLRKEIKTALASLKPGNISPVLDLETDFFIVLMEDYKPAGIQTFEEVREKLEGDLRQEEGERLYAEWIKRLKNRHHVQIFEATTT